MAAETPGRRKGRPLVAFLPRKNFVLDLFLSGVQHGCRGGTTFFFPDTPPVAGFSRNDATEAIRELSSSRVCLFFLPLPNARGQDGLGLDGARGGSSASVELLRSEVQVRHVGLVGAACAGDGEGERAPRAAGDEEVEPGPESCPVMQLQVTGRRFCWASVVVPSC